ncbi:hypothetical protein EZS27_025154 [termite gut metagenome]|uniref:MobA protein n=1 Tax=termite gut metagenome TaxID=433724 RepID=A0A5J4QYZ6_9ZZZZ
MSIENAEKKKRGRKPKANPQTHRYQFRLNSQDHERLLSMFKCSGKRSVSVFIADCMLNKHPKVVYIDKVLIDYTMLLSSFHAQFRAIKNNFNQVYRTLALNLGEKKAFEMIQIVTSIREFGLLKQEIEETIIKFRELCLPK